MLSDKKKDVTPKIPIEIKPDNTEETIHWLLQQKESWVVHEKEINAARTYQHVWLSASYKNSIIGSIKIGFNKIYIADFNRILSLPKDTAFIYDTFVSKKYRNKGIAQALITSACNLMQSKGFQKIGCHIPPWNTASIRAYETCGFQQKKYIRFIQLCGIPIVFSKPLKNQDTKGSWKLGKVNIPYESTDIQCV